jgi:RecB family endonuclease NucS
VRLVIARCSVDYIGRLTAHLPMASRLLLVKADGSVSIHADDRAYKPLNWMSPPCTLKDDLVDGAGTRCRDVEVAAAWGYSPVATERPHRRG